MEFCNNGFIKTIKFDENLNIDSRFLDEEAVHLWTIKLSETKNKLDFFKNLLCSDEIKKAGKFRFEDDQLRSIIGRGSLRFLMSKYIGLSPEKILFEYGDKGKPYIEEIKRKGHFSFNISHSGDIILIGFSCFENIGVDVERIRLSNDFKSIAFNYFHPLEIKFLDSFDEDEKNNIFFQIWTLKEAFLKSTGQGLGKPLKSFSVVDENQEFGLIENGFLNKPIQVNSLKPSNEYFGGVCFF